MMQLGHDGPHMTESARAAACHEWRASPQPSVSLPPPRVQLCVRPVHHDDNFCGCNPWITCNWIFFMPRPQLASIGADGVLQLPFLTGVGDGGQV